MVDQNEIWKREKQKTDGKKRQAKQTKYILHWGESPSWMLKQGIGVWCAAQFQRSGRRPVWPDCFLLLYLLVQHLLLCVQKKGIKGDLSHKTSTWWISHKKYNNTTTWWTVFTLKFIEWVNILICIWTIKGIIDKKPYSTVTNVPNHQ